MLDEPLYPTAPRKTTFSEGLEFQDFVCDCLARRHIILQNHCSKKYQLDVGENLQGFEIKLDTRCTETGRLSIEIAEKSDARFSSWTPSGIYRNDNAWLYIQGNYEVIFIFAVNWLRRYHAAKRPQEHESYGTVRKFYISVREATICAVKVIDLR